MHQHLRAGLREKQADLGYILKMVKTYLCYIFDVWNKTGLESKSYPNPDHLDKPHSDLTIFIPLHDDPTRAAMNALTPDQSPSCPQEPQPATIPRSHAPAHWAMLRWWEEQQTPHLPFQPPTPPLHLQTTSWETSSTCSACSAPTW